MFGGKLIGFVDGLMWGVKEGEVEFEVFGLSSRG